MSGIRRAEAAPPTVERFQCIAVTFTRGRGTSEEPMRQCIAYYQITDNGDADLFAIYDPKVGVDPQRFPPGDDQ